MQISVFFTPTKDVFRKITRDEDSCDHHRFTEEYYDDIFLQTAHSLRRVIYSCYGRGRYLDRIQWVSEEAGGLDSPMGEPLVRKVEYQDNFILGALDSLHGITPQQIKRDSLFKPPSRSWCTWRWQVTNPKDQSVYYVDLCHEPCTGKFACIGGVLWVSGSLDQVLTLARAALGPDLHFYRNELGYQSVGRAGIIESLWSLDTPFYIKEARGENVLHAIEDSLISPRGLPLQLRLWKHENPFLTQTIGVTLMRFVGKSPSRRFPRNRDLKIEGFFQAPLDCDAMTLCERMDVPSARLMTYGFPDGCESESGYRRVRDIEPGETLRSVYQKDSASSEDDDCESDNESESEPYLVLVWYEKVSPVVRLGSAHPDV